MHKFSIPMLLDLLHFTAPRSSILSFFRVQLARVSLKPYMNKCFVVKKL